MSDEASFGAPPDGASGTSPTGAINVGDEQEVQTWARKLNVTEMQIRDAVKAVGARPTDVEEHLKGSRATTDAEQTRAANAR